MKRLFLILLLLLWPAMGVLMAIPAKPGIIHYRQPDGSVMDIQLHGDEWGHWTTDPSGRVLKMDEDGYYHLADVSPEVARQGAAMRRSMMRDVVYRMPSLSTGYALGEKHFLVILVDFPDKKFKDEDPQAAFSDMLNQEGYKKNRATGSARDYYYENSHGQFTPIFDVYGPYELPNNASFYGTKDAKGNERGYVALLQGCKGLDSAIDFSQYDHDGDGEVDLTFMFYAGFGEADGGGEDTIWPHQWFLSSAGVSFRSDGVNVNRYACANELEYASSRMCGMGTAAHEFGHAMGLPDFYDTDYETNGTAGSLYHYSLMCSGSYLNEGRTPPYLNIMERIILGWVDQSALKTFDRSGSYSLTSVKNDVAYMTPTDMDDEFFIYECRDGKGWDKYLSGMGLLVYHVDMSSRVISFANFSSKASDLWKNWKARNAINANGTHPCFYLIPSTAQNKLYLPSSEEAGIPFPGSKNIQKYTPLSWNNVKGETSFSDITFEDGVVTMMVTAPERPDIPKAFTYNFIANPGKGVYTAGDSFSFQLLQVTGRKPEWVKWYFDGESTSSEAVTLTAGKHRIEAEMSLGEGKTDTVTLEINVQ